MRASNITLRSAFSSAVYNYGGKAFSTIFTIISFVIVARSLSVDDYAHYISYLNAVFFVTIFLDFGIAEVFLRYIPEYLEKRELSFIKNLIKTSIKIVTYGCALLLLLTISALMLFPGFFARLHLDRIGVFIVLFGWARIVSIVLGSALNAFFFQFFRITCELVISLVRLVLVYIFLKHGSNAWTLVVIYAVMDLLLAALFYLRIHGYLGNVISKKDHEGLVRISSFGFNEYLYRLFWFFTDNRFDIYIVGIILGMTQAGYYAFAASIVNLLIDWSPGFIIKPVVGPLFIREYTAKKDPVKMRYLFELHNKFLVFITLPVFLFFGILMDKFILYVFDPKYMPSIQVFFIFIISMFFINFIIPLRNIVALVERPDISNLSNIVAIPKLILVVILSITAGIKGAALAYALSLFGIIWMHIFFLSKVIKLTYPWRSFMKIAVNSIVMGALLYALRDCVVNKATLCLVSAAGAASYLAAAYINKAFDPEDRSLFNRAIKADLWCF